VSGPPPFTLALAQMRVEPGAREENLARAEARIADAARTGAALVLLPEALPLGWMEGWTEDGSRAGGIPEGEDCRAMAEAARRHGLFVCAGLVEKAEGRIFNAAVLISPKGEILLHHRKIHELGIAHHCYALGDRLGVAETALGRIGLMICADGFAPGQVIARTLGLMGAQLILSPCAWAVPPGYDNAREPYGKLWLENYGPPARENGLWIAGCSNVGPIRNGPWAGHWCIGNSLVVGPDGAERVRGGHGEGAEELIHCKITLQPARRCSAD